MNSEELEQSLRTEFESLLKQISADAQQETTQFQERIEAEFERHKSQMTEFFQEFSGRFQTLGELDAGFRDSVVEHLRLARDEGARITATAFAEAEEMARKDAEAAVPAAGIGELRDGINDISSQSSQAAILKSLVEHAEPFTPRGAFFIIKNEHFVGWRVFGRENEADDSTAREIFFPVSAESTLGESIRSLAPVEGAVGTNSDDSIYLDKLDFGAPATMYAIPLVARGRGVAVLYADRGTKGEEVNIDALETLVRVAGLTVEVLAASTSSAKPAAARQNTDRLQRPSKTEESQRQQQEQQQQQFVEQKGFVAAEADSPASVENRSGDFDEQSGYETAAAAYDSSTVPETIETAATDAKGFEYSSESENSYSENGFQAKDSSSDFNNGNYSTEEYTGEEIETPVEAEEIQPAYSNEAQPETESYSWNQPAAGEAGLGEFAGNTDSLDSYEQTESLSYEYEPAVLSEADTSSFDNEYKAKTSQPFEGSEHSVEEIPQFDTSQFASTFSPAEHENIGSFDTGNAVAENFAAVPSPAAAPVAVGGEATVQTKPARSRFSDRNVDLPIEVTEDERRLHNDARRFARLLVSEIKLYNEQRVKEGREHSDLYERLREAIDRSREMYDKRIQPPVAAKFDYFHYEVVNTLVEGDETKLGDGYPGATV